MSGNLLGMVHRHLDEATIDGMASLLGQSRHTIHSAVDQVAAVLVGGLAQKASSREGARELYKSLDRVEDGILNDVPGYLASNTSHVTQAGTGILGFTFGPDLGNVIARLAPSTGLGEAGTSSVMKIMAPIVLAVVARHKRREHLDEPGLARFLDDQRRDVNAALPSNMTGLFGTSPGSYGELGEDIGEDRERADRSGGPPIGDQAGMHPRHGGGGPSALYKEQLGPERGGPRPKGERSMGLRWLVPLLGVAAIVALVYGLLRHRDVDRVDAIDPAVHGVQEERPGADHEGEGAQAQPAQPEGDEPLYLGTLFDAGSAELTVEPENRLNALLQLVEDNPDQNVEVRGYAFGTDTEETRQLAEDRAEAVKQWLVDNGVDEQRIQAVGGGTSARSQIDVFLR